jgi:hypothetical protein
MFILLAY